MDKMFIPLKFKNDLGKIVGLAYHFTGTAAIDYVRLKNGEGKMVYEEEFEEKMTSK